MSSVKKYSEEELVVLLKQKDKEAFSYLYDSYSAALNGIVFRMVDAKELAEDILQEAFIKIWANIENYDSSKGRLFTWMLNITRNLTIDIFRSKGYKKQQKISGNENSVSNVQDKNYRVDQFDAMGIAKHLSHLKPDQKRIIDLAYFNGYTQEEIAKDLSMPLGTVKTKMRMAIIELKKMFQYN